MKKLLLILCALLGTVGAMATDVTVINSSQDATTYGSLSSGTFTTNDASGMAGVTISGVSSTTATYFAYGACLGFTSVSSGTVTMTAPEGYIITGYTFTGRLNTYAAVFTITPSAGGEAKALTTGGVVVSAGGLTSQTASFTYSCSSTNSWYIPSLVISIMSATAPTVNVTYELYESNGTTLVNSVVKTQEANSSIDVPASLNSKTYYNYAPSGNIGEEDCTIKVIRTLKDGVVIATSGLSNNKCYNIRNNRGTWAVGSGATDVNSTVELGLAFLSSDVKQQFAIIGYEGNFYLYSVGESKFAYVDGNKLSLTSVVNSAVAESPVTFQASTASSANDEPIIVTIGDQMYGVSTGKSPDVFKYNYANDGGNSSLIIEAGDFDPTAALDALEKYFYPTYFITYKVVDGEDNQLFISDAVGTTLGATITTLPAEYQLTDFYTYNTISKTISETNTTVTFTATLKDAPLVKFTSDATNPVWYKMKIKDANYPTYVADENPNVTLPTTNADDETVQWAFIGEPYAGFKIINRAANDATLVLGSANPVGDGASGGNTYATFATAGSQAYEKWFAYSSTYLTGGFFLFNEAGTALNQRSNDNLAYWTDGYDKGSTFTVTEVKEGEDLYNALVEQLEALNIGTGLNQYSLTGVYAEYTTNPAALINTLKGKFTDENKATVEDVLEHYTINLPTAGFYRIKGKTSSKYLAAGMASNNKFNMTNAEDATTIFYFDGTKLTNLSSGLNNGLRTDHDNISGWAWVISEPSTVSFVDGNTNGGYGIQSRDVYIYDNGDAATPSADRGTSASMVNGNVRYRSWQLETVTTLPVSISSVRYATFFCPVAVTIPDGVDAYYVSALSETEATLTEIDATIPAETAVILTGDEGSYNFAITTDVEAISGNKLAGTAAAIEYIDGAYTLQTNKDNSSEVGLYPTAVDYLAGFKAYLPATAFSSEAKGFTFRFSDIETVINSISAKQNGSVFDLSGRRVSKPAAGLYIENGKKVAIK